MNIYVGNLAYSITDAELKSAFEPYGQVISAEVIVDKRTRRSRGYGFVRMANEAQGRAAIQALDGREFQGRPLRVDESKPGSQEKRSPASRGGRSSRGHGRHQRPATSASAAPAAPARGVLSFFKKIFSRG
ncbi:MAG TPA: RNA-binding protein [Gammaproteobacteria bacterium]|nr:RNA-binding protein [Gammaproteobacteria bacterium]